MDHSSGIPAPPPPSVRLVQPAGAAAIVHDMDLLRLATAGSVDDGKSTLIGRLLYDTKSIFEDQLEAVEGASRRRGEDGINLALLTDGLRAEREQNITIDVAYRYFATPRRKFIIADTPGHVQYTRNMVTGASTAEVAIVLVDARKGVQTQSKRHGFIASLLRIPHVVVAVNKMDLVGYDEGVYQVIVDEYTEFAGKLDVQGIAFIPISALHGDNVVERSPRMSWYGGATLLHYLETVNVGASRNLIDFRFPVQHVIRPNQDFRGFSGRIASGTIAPGEEVMVLPARQASRIRDVLTADGPVAEAAAGDSVVLTLEDEIDVSRGDMIVRRHNLPAVESRLDAMLCWMAEAPLDPSVPYLLLHTSRTAKAFVDEVLYRIDVDTLHREDAARLGLNDIGRVRITTAHPICLDPYALNRATGGFVLVDPYTHATVAAGMIRGPARGAESVDTAAPPREAVRAATHVVWEGWNVPRAEREARNGHRAVALWFTGIPGSGKTTLARALERRLFELGCQTMLLDGDHLRHGLNADLGFTPPDRRENVRRVGEVARLFFEQGSIVLCSFVSPYQADRARARSLFPEGAFLEVFVDCPVEEARRRDPKGHYARAASGEIGQFTGVSAAYEPPEAAEIVVRSSRESVEESVEGLLETLRRNGLVPQGHAAALSDRRGSV